MTSEMHILSFAEKLRAGGGGRTEIRYWDYLVNGTSLRELLRVGDFIPPFGWLTPDADTRFRGMLTRKVESDIPSRRTPLFVCPECADYGCGVFTAVVERDGDDIVWHSFGMERDYDGTLDPVAEHLQTRFVFDCRSYWLAFSSLAIFPRTPLPAP